MNSTEIIEKIRMDLSCAYLEANDLLVRLENIEYLYDDHKQGLAFKRELKQTTTLYLNASGKLIKQLDKLIEKISDVSKDDATDNYRKLLDELPKAMGRLDLSLKKIINNEK